MPSDGRLPPERRARRVVYKLVADFLELVVEGRVRFGDLDELARAAKLWKHPKGARFHFERGGDADDVPVDVEILKNAMRDVASEMRRALNGRSAGKSPRKRLAGARKPRSWGRG